jgi:hypothetical protein
MVSSAGRGTGLVTTEKSRRVSLNSHRVVALAGRSRYEKRHGTGQTATSATHGGRARAERDRKQE